MVIPQTPWNAGRLNEHDGGDDVSVDGNDDVNVYVHAKNGCGRVLFPA